MGTDITMRCRHCGSTRKEHTKHKPYLCPTRLRDTSWEPWSAEGYEAAVEAGKTAVNPAKAAPEMEDGIVLEPDYHFLFRRFLEDARNAGASLDLDLAAAHSDGRQSVDEHLGNHAKVLRVVQGLVAPLTICLQSATSASEVQQLREVMAKTLEKLDQDATKTEARFWRDI